MPENVEIMCNFESYNSFLWTTDIRRYCSVQCVIS